MSDCLAMNGAKRIERRNNMAGVYSAGDFRNGTTFEMEGNVFRVVEFQHVKPGKGYRLQNRISVCNRGGCLYMV